MKINIKEVAKTMTRKDFLEEAMRYNFGKLNSENDCPNCYGLKEIELCEISCENCKECWSKAVKDIKFKDDMEDKKMNKELNIIEASSMPLGTEFKVIFKDGSKCSHIVSFGNCKFYQDKNVDDSIHVLFINATFIPIQQPVSFMEALKSGKRVRVDIDDLIFTDIKYKFNTYQRMEELIELMGIELTFTGKKNVILNGRWYVEND
ncbi:hypothetical protein FC961_14595 [Clostridium botulinum]|nr:hypothetical protein [Clostridium botulinum]NFO92485.1 hypothetical protein [Clostridium botulinum]